MYRKYSYSKWRVLSQGGNNITAIIEHYPYIAILILSILGGIGVPFFPEDATFILCGFLLHSNVLKLIPALFVIYVGVLIGDFIIYLFGRKYGRMAVHHRWFQKFLSPERLVMLKDKFKKKGVYVILFGRQLIGVRVQIILIAGIMRMDIVKFFWANAITVTLRIAVMGSIGYAGGHSLEEIGIDVSKITYVVTFLLISSFIGYFLFRYIRGKRRN
jgi:membrane protein DedA with SNARE-associated domain